VWLLGRTGTTGRPADLRAATQLMGRFALTPLADWVAGERRAETVVPSFPTLAATRVPGGLAFYDALGAVLAHDPPPARDTCALRALARVGIRPGATPSHGRDAVVRRALRAAPAIAARLLSATVADMNRASRRRYHGWLVPGSSTGHFGTRFLARAVLTRVGLGANDVRHALYPIATTDSGGRALSGAHRYLVEFARGQLPPVRSFWSLTLYDAAGFFHPNPLGRYALGDRSAGLRRSPDGSLRIYVQRRAPRPALRSNWLPAPRGAFRLMLRLYDPKSRAARGRWPLPVVRRVG
jgi:hypothetical protein